MTGRKFKLFLALLAVALNIVSAPMAWARMAAHMTHPQSASMTAMENCAGHMNSTKPSNTKFAGTEHAPCCKGGSCNCGWLPAAAMSVPYFPRVSVTPHFDGLEPVQAVPASPVEDPLRPPIS